MNIIERAARAMHSSINPDWNWDDPDAQLLRRMYLGNVRTVLLTLRNPDEEMIGAADDLIDLSAGIHPTGIEVWHRMIDVALDENEE